jgi:hypothetical protein
MRPHGQMSLEMVSGVGFVLLMLIAFSVVSFSRYQEFVYERDSIAAKSVARQVATEINVAMASGSGYSRVFELPQTLEGGAVYSVAANSTTQAVEIAWGALGYSYWIPMLSSDVEEKTLLPGNNTVSNDGGVVRFA